MTTAATRKREIAELEGFEVEMYRAGQPVSADTQGLPAYARNFERRARGNWTVAEWKEKRFKTIYPELDVEVLCDDGSVAHGNTLLATVRQTYEEQP